MRSLVILEVEHGDDTDAVQAFSEHAATSVMSFDGSYMTVLDYTVRIDLPTCFRMEH